MPYADPDTYRQYQRAYREANRKRLQTYYRDWASTNRDALRKNSQAFYRKHRDEELARNKTRNRNRRAFTGSATSVQVNARAAMFGNSCYLCGGAWEAIDHVIPLARGGSGWASNLRPICTACNSRKGARDWRKFLAN